MDKPNRFYSKKQETQVAKAMGARVTANSGATQFDKGDVSGTDILVECKTVTKKQQAVTIKEEWIHKNSEEAFARGKDLSALAFNFGPNEPNYYILSEQDFLAMYEAWTRELEGGQN